MLDQSRIKNAVDLFLLSFAKIVIVGAGGTFDLALSLVRMGIIHLTVIDFDTVEASNVCRQGFDQVDIGSYKVDALERAAKRINPSIQIRAIKEDICMLNDDTLDSIFGHSDLNIFGTDSFKAQAFGNIISLKYNTPAIWGGWYQGSKTGEIFFQIPGITKACFRCCTSSRYQAQAEQSEEIKASSDGNTIFHSHFLDSLIGFVAMAILHRGHIVSSLDEKSADTFSPLKDAAWLLADSTSNTSFEHNFFQFKVHPEGGNKLFEQAYGALGLNAFNFQTYWQKIEPELPEFGYDYTCPDCQGKLYRQALVDKESSQ